MKISIAILLHEHHFRDYKRGIHYDKEEIVGIELLKDWLLEEGSFKVLE